MGDGWKVDGDWNVQEEEGDDEDGRDGDCRSDAMVNINCGHCHQNVP